MDTVVICSDPTYTWNIHNVSTVSLDHLEVPDVFGAIRVCDKREMCRLMDISYSPFLPNIAFVSLQPATDIEKILAVKALSPTILVTNADDKYTKLLGFTPKRHIQMADLFIHHSYDEDHIHTRAMYYIIEYINTRKELNEKKLGVMVKDCIHAVEEFKANADTDQIEILHGILMSIKEIIE